MGFGKCAVRFAAGRATITSGAGVARRLSGRSRTRAHDERLPPTRPETGPNVRGQVDYGVRAAFLNLNAAKEQVAVAKQNVDLANENLARSKDRFTSGVTDSVEVVQAEQSLASANDQYITSLYDHNLAKLSLARALGVARTSYEQYLGGK